MTNRRIETDAAWHCKEYTDQFIRAMDESTRPGAARAACITRATVALKAFQRNKAILPADEQVEASKGLLEWSTRINREHKAQAARERRERLAKLFAPAGRPTHGAARILCFCADCGNVFANATHRDLHTCGGRLP